MSLLSKKFHFSIFIHRSFSLANVFRFSSNDVSSNSSDSTKITKNQNGLINDGSGVDKKGEKSKTLKNIDSQPSEVGKEQKKDDKFIIVGPDGIPYDPSKDLHYTNEYMGYKYPQYFTKNLGGFIKTIKTDFSILKKGRIHKIREELEPPAEVDVCIFGGGIIGSSIAYFLKEKAPFSLNVAVVEQDPTYTRAATTMSVGAIRQQFSMPENVLMSLFGAEFLRNSRRNLCILDGEPPDINFHPQGFLILANESEAQEMIENHQQQIELGAMVELYTVDRIKEKFPMINTDGIVLGSYGVENEGWFDPYALLIGLKAKAMSLGCEYVHAEVVDFNLKYHDEVNTTTSNYVVIREPDGNCRQIHFTFGVVACGYNSMQIANFLGHGADINDGRRYIDFPIEPRKRYVYSFNCKNGPGLNFPLLVDDSKTFCRREGLGGNFICGRSPLLPDEEPAIDNLEMDYSYFEKNIRPELVKRVPSFATLKQQGGWAGFYDVNRVDQNPIIGKDPFFPNFIWAVGFGGYGIQMAPAVGRSIMELILYDDFKTIDMRRFGWHRLLSDQPLKERYQF